MAIIKGTGTPPAEESTNSGAGSRELKPINNPPSPSLDKDKRIWISGIMQAVITSPALVPFITRAEDFAPVVEAETRKCLAIHKRLMEE